MVTQRSGPQGKPGEKWLRDLTPDNATAPAPDPTPDNSGVVLRRLGGGRVRPAAGGAAARNIGTDSQVGSPGSRLLMIIISTQP